MEAVAPEASANPRADVSALLLTPVGRLDSIQIPWGYSSIGRALRSHRRGRGFESPYLHQAKTQSVTPPSITRVIPVVKLDASEAK